ncbi:diacylglycerol kinase family protein, partial [Bacteroidota bacterium]
LRKEANFVIHTIAAVLVIVAGFFFSISRTEWIVVALTIGAVMAAEAMNTSVEKLCDRFMPGKDPDIKVIKDTAAASVLIISIAAAVVGCIVFLPYLIQFFQDL